MDVANWTAGRLELLVDHVDVTAKTILVMEELFAEMAGKHFFNFAGCHLLEIVLRGAFDFILGFFLHL